MREVAIIAERHLPQQEIAHRIEAVGLDPLQRIADVAERLRYLLSLVRPPAMGEDAAWRLQAGRHQDGRPIDSMNARDTLADHMHVGWPVTPEFRALRVGEAAGR